MNQALICTIFAVAAIQGICSEGIQVPFSGSKSYQLTIRFATNQDSNKYHRLEILNTHHGHSRYSLRSCHIVSMKLLTGLRRTRSMLYGAHLLRYITKQDDNILQFTIPHRKLVHLPNAVIVAKLDCKGQRWVLTSIVNSEDEHQWNPVRRKLLGFKSIVNHDSRISSFPFFSVVFAIAVVLALVITLAMCACGRHSHVEKTLSDEVGGTDLHQQVIGVSTTLRVEEHKNSEHPQNGSTERRNTATSQHSSVFVANNETARTASQSSNQGDITHIDSTGSQSSTKILEASSSHKSIDQIESETLLTTPNAEQVRNKEKIRSASEKQHQPTSSNSKDSRSLSQSDALAYNGKEANVAISNRNHSVQPISRKHSDKKDSKETKQKGDGREEHKGKRNWLRRKPSKNKANVEVKSFPDNEKNSPTPGRHSTIPLPPTPNAKDAPTFLEEDNQYESVEPRERKAVPLPMVDNNYDTVDDVKRNSQTVENSRPASELYECINDDQSKLKRNALANPDYDAVETKPKPPQIASDPNSLEYAYSVVAPRDNLAIPQETSGSSGLYEVVTDDIKKLSGITAAHVSVDDTYAVVHKDPSKVKQQTRPLSDTVPASAPPPPPVSSLRYVTVSSEKQRSQSEGDDLNVAADDDEPTSSTCLLDRKKVQVDHTYAKVNKSLKRKTPDQQLFMGETAISDGVEVDTPPPIPPSLYAELPVKDEGLHESAAVTTTSLSVDSSETSSSRDSRLNNMNSKTCSDTLVLSHESTKVTSQESVNKIITVTPDTRPTTSTNNPSSDVNPLYQVIHYV